MVDEAASTPPGDEGPTPPSDEAPKPLRARIVKPDPNPEGPLGERLDLAVFESELASLRHAIPVIPPPLPSKLVTGLAMALLIGFGLAGAPPSGALARSEMLDPESAGEPMPFDIDAKHEVSSPELDLLFEVDGKLAAARARGDEGGAMSDELDILYVGIPNLDLRILDDNGEPEGGRPRSLRTLEDGVLMRREYLDDCLQADISYRLGRSEAGEPRRQVEVLIEARNISSRETLSFSLELRGVESMFVPIADIKQAHAAALTRSSDGSIAERHIAIDAVDHDEPIDDAFAVAASGRYEFAALIAELDEADRSHRRGILSLEYMLDPPGMRARLGLASEGLTLKPGESLTQRYRLVLGPRTSWTLAGIEAPRKDALLRGWPGFRLLQELIMDFLRGVLRVIASPGVALLLIGVLTAMILRPLQVPASWSSARGAALKPVFAALQERQAELGGQLKDSATRRQLRQLTSGAISDMKRDHGVRGGLGCLVYLFILPVLFAYHDAVYEGFALRGAGFLWAASLIEPDALMTFAEPLVSLDFSWLAPLLYGVDPQAVPDELREQLTWRIATLNLFAVILYLLPWVETLILWKMGVKPGFRPIRTLLFFALFMLLFYNAGSGIILGFLAVRLVWSYDSIRLTRALIKGHEAARRPAAETPRTLSAAPPPAPPQPPVAPGAGEAPSGPGPEA